MQQHSVKYEKQLCNSNKKPSNNYYSKGYLLDFIVKICIMYSVKLQTKSRAQ